jgi:hypothetical protein
MNNGGQSALRGDLDGRRVVWIRGSEIMTRTMAQELLVDQVWEVEHKSVPTDCSYLIVVNREYDKGRPSNGGAIFKIHTGVQL